MNEFNLEQKILHRLILQSPSIEDLGLLHGKMGIALFFFEYGRHTGCNVYTDIGGELLDDLWEQIHTELSFCFDSGLSGIGWGIEYLLQNYFIEGDGNEVCEEIDRKVMQTDLKRLDDSTLDTGLEGLFYYISARMQGAVSQNNPLPFDSVYRENLACVSSYLATCNQAGFYRRYPVSVNPFLNSISVAGESYSSVPLGLKEGIAGFLLKQIREL